MGAQHLHQPTVLTRIVIVVQAVLALYVKPDIPVAQVADAQSPLPQTAMIQTAHLALQALVLFVNQDMLLTLSEVAHYPLQTVKIQTVYYAQQLNAQYVDLVMI